MAVDGTFYRGVDQDIEFTGVKVRRTSAYLNNAEATFTLKDRYGETISEGVLNYVAASNGNYYGVLNGDDTTDVVSSVHTLEVVFVKDDYRDQRTLKLQAADRKLT